MTDRPPEGVACVYIWGDSLMFYAVCVIAWVAWVASGVDRHCRSTVGGCPGDGWGSFLRGVIANCVGQCIVMGVGSIGDPRV